MRKLLVPLPFCATLLCPAQRSWTFSGDTTATWEQAIARYDELDHLHTKATLITIGNDDDGSLIHLFVIGADPATIRSEGKNVLWITNAIHAGEPDGVDASLMLAQALLEDDHLTGLTEHTVVCIVPMYNVSGARQRQRPSRPDQNGPVSHGMRANARNLDLNRDFIKMDAQNTWAMITALAFVDPDVYFETHVSDGADHQYVMELLLTQKDRLSSALSDFMTGTLEPELSAWMAKEKIKMCPYFETLEETPEAGLMAFYDAPRYSTGFNALFDRIGVLSESHMLKAYADRVNATFQLMLATLGSMEAHHDELARTRKSAKDATAAASGFGFNFKLDTTTTRMLTWEGYVATHDPSPVSGYPVLGYDHARPTRTTVPWFEHYEPAFTIAKPAGYLVPAAWREAIERLRIAGVPLGGLNTDSMISAEAYRVEDFHTSEAPIEGHYRHNGVRCSVTSETLTVHKGDVIVPMGSPADRFVMNVLEPQAEDSWFNWGFFDAILQQKEWFNAYAFEGIAADLLKKDVALREALDEKRATDPALAADAWSQLYFVFQRSPWFEEAYRRYPVLRILK